MTRIGITCDTEAITDSRGVEARRYVLDSSYVKAILECGGLPIILPCCKIGSIPHLLADVDGVVISGGDFDIPPSYYGESPNPGLGPLREERSWFEKEVVECCLQETKPVLGICGGLSERPDTDQHIQPQPRQEPHHVIEITADSQLARLYGVSQLDVNSTHHQIIKQVGDGMTVAGMAPDGVIEAIESSRHRFVVGVQWHPEILGTELQLSIYRGLISASKS